MPLTLTPIEFDILWLLCENRGKVISSEELFEKVWHEKYYKNSNNTVMVHIRHLREKMSAPTGKSDFIKTVWGVGFKVEELLSEIKIQYPLADGAGHSAYRSGRWGTA